MSRKKYIPSAESLLGIGIFSPCFLTEDEYHEGYKESVFYVEEGYREEYLKLLSGASHIASIAKSYIIKNWKKVKDWSDLEVVLTHTPTGEQGYYYTYKEIESTRKKRSVRSSKNSIGDLLKNYEKRRKRNQNPILSIEMVLDPTDGDFSVTINGNEYWWIPDEEVIIIADYIETQLKKENVP